MRNWLLLISLFFLISCQTNEGESKRFWARIDGDALQEQKRDQLYLSLLHYDALIDEYIVAVQKNQPRIKAMDELFALYATVLDPYFEDLAFNGEVFEQWLAYVYTLDQQQVLRDHQLFSLEQPLMLYHINALAQLLSSSKMSVVALVSTLFPDNEDFDAQRWQALSEHLELLLQQAIQQSSHI